MKKKVKEAIEMVEAEGWKLVRMKGDHRQFTKPGSFKVITIAGKPNDDMDRGTLGNIIRAMRGG